MTDSPYTLKRREVLRNVAMLLGVAAITPGIASAVLAATDTAGSKLAPRTLTPTRLRLVAKLGEMIIPETDTPGATKAGVHIFIDALLTDNFTASHRERFLSGLQAVDMRAAELGFANFLAADGATQYRIVKSLDEEAYGPHADALKVPFFREFKELVLIGFYTSEVGASIELAYAPVPGAYKGCVPLAKEGRAWATNGFTAGRRKYTAN